MMKLVMPITYQIILVKQLTSKKLLIKFKETIVIHQGISNHISLQHPSSTIQRKKN